MKKRIAVLFLALVLAVSSSTTALLKNLRNTP